MKLSTAQQALIHTLISVGVSALLTIAGLIYQFVLGHGLDFPNLLKFIGPVFLGQLSLIWMSLRSNPNLQQAETDTIHEALQGLHDKLDNLLPFLHSHTSPPVGGSVVAPVQPAPLYMPQNVTAAAQPAPVPQLPFPQAINTTLSTPVVKP